MLSLGIDADCSRQDVSSASLVRSKWYKFDF